MGSYASVVEGRREREREGGRQKAKGRERSGKSAKEEEQRQRFSSLKKVSFGLAFCHPLLTSVQPFSGKFSNVCHPLRPFLLHGQCLSDRSPRQSHGNRDGFTVAGNPCRIYRLHSSGYVFLYLPFRISSAPSPSLRQLQQGGALSRTTACTSSLSALLASCYEDIFFFLLSFFFFRKNFQSEVENFLISHAKLYERITVIHFWPILLRIGQRYTVLVSKIATSNSSGSSRASFVNINSNPDHIRRDTKRESPAFPHRN